MFIVKKLILLTIKELLIVFIMFKLDVHRKLNNLLAKGNLFAHKKEQNIPIQFP